MKEKKIGTLQAAAVIITVMISHIILNMPNHLISSTRLSNNSKFGLYFHYSTCDFLHCIKNI